MRNEVKKNILIIIGGFGLFLLLVWIIFFRLPLNYSALPISGKVVDADTGEPLGNVIVIAIWQLERGFGLEGTIPSGFMNVVEVVTDEGGNYFIEGWGPRRRPGGTYLGKDAPRLVFFKDGYNHFSYANFTYLHRRDNRRKSTQSSGADGATIKLKEFDGDLEGYIQVLSSVSSNLSVILNPIFGAKSCDWKNIPKTITEIEKHNINIETAGIRTSLIVPLDVLIKRKECSVDDKEEFMLEHSL